MKSILFIPRNFHSSYNWSVFCIFASTCESQVTNVCLQKDGGLFLVHNFSRWWLNHPFEKYSSKNMIIFPHFCGVKIQKNMWNHHLYSFVYKLLRNWVDDFIPMLYGNNMKQWELIHNHHLPPAYSHSLEPRQVSAAVLSWPSMPPCLACSGSETAGFWTRKTGCLITWRSSTYSPLRYCQNSEFMKTHWFP